MTFRILLLWLKRIAFFFFWIDELPFVWNEKYKKYESQSETAPLNKSNILGNVHQKRTFFLLRYLKSKNFAQVQHSVTILYRAKEASITWEPSEYFQSDVSAKFQLRNICFYSYMKLDVWRKEYFIDWRHNQSSVKKFQSTDTQLNSLMICLRMWDKINYTALHIFE